MSFAIRAAIGFSALAPAGFDEVNEGGNAQALAKVLFSKYFFPFEVTSILLIIAAIAAMVLAQRKSHAVTQAEMEAHNAALEPAAPGPVGMSTPISYFLVLSSILFAIGSVGVLVRKNALIIFMSVELQLNAVNLTLVAFSRMHNSLNGQVLAFFSMVVAAAEVVVGLAIIVSVYRRIRSVNVDDAEALRG